MKFSGIVGWFQCSLQPDWEVTYWRKAHTWKSGSDRRGKPCFFLFETQLTPSLPCVFSQIRSNPASKNDEGDDWLLLNYKLRSLPQGLRNTQFPRTDSLIFLFVSVDPALPPWLSSGPWHQWFGAETQPQPLLPRDVTPPSPIASSYKHIYFANYSGDGSSLGGLPSSFGRRHHPLHTASSDLRSWQPLPANSFPLTIMFSLWGRKKAPGGVSACSLLISSFLVTVGYGQQLTMPGKTSTTPLRPLLLHKPG